MLRAGLLLLAFVATQESPSPRPMAQATPQPIQAYSIDVMIEATAPQMKAPAQAAPEALAVMGLLKDVTKLESRFLLTLDTSRQEILSTDFPLPAGSLIYHKAGDKLYAIADPKTKTYAVMDSAALLNALEGGAGIENSQYQVKVQHTPEKRKIAGFDCRKSVVTVTYVSSIPLENDRVLVQKKNDVVVWHTSQLVSSAGMDHLFFKFQRDKTGNCRKVLAAEIGFPMDVSFTVTGPAGATAATPQPGSFHMAVTAVKTVKVERDTFRIPPAGYQKVNKNPFAGAAAGR
jgi:hypothetical protein